jgi:hypothetical protein
LHLLVPSGDLELPLSCKLSLALLLPLQRTRLPLHILLLVLHQLLSELIVPALLGPSIKIETKRCCIENKREEP